MDNQTLIIVGIVGVLFLILISLYNRLVALRQGTRQAFADIDVQLKLRLDLLPNLIETVKGFASHEKTLLQNLTEARTRSINAKDMNAQIAAQSSISGSLTSLFAVAENYPDLKANQNFMQLQRDLSDIENKIAAARRFFNSAVTEYNTSLQQFPAVLFAKLFGFEACQIYDIPENQKAAAEAAPKVSF